MKHDSLCLRYPAGRVRIAVIACLRLSRRRAPRALYLDLHAPRLASGPAVAATPAAPSPPALRIVSPPDGAVYLIDPTLRRQFQTVPLRASAATPASRLQWFVDGHPVRTAGADDEVRWPLVPGKHRVEAHDAAGRRSAADVTVK